MMDFGKILELVTDVFVALKMAQALPTGAEQEIDTPDIEVSYKGHHYKITGMTVLKVS